jgi:hypothetical protein
LDYSHLIAEFYCRHRMIPQNASKTFLKKTQGGFLSAPAPLNSSTIATSTNVSGSAPSESLSLVSQAALLYTRGEELLLQNSAASIAECAPLIEASAQLGYLPAQVR